MTKHTNAGMEFLLTGTGKFTPENCAQYQIDSKFFIHDLMALLSLLNIDH